MSLKRQWRCALGVLVCAALHGGCAKKVAMEASAAPASPDAADAYGDGAMAGEAAPEDERDLAYGSDLESLQAEFDRLDADLSSEGIVGASSTSVTAPTKAAAKKDEATRCERICDLKVAICDVAERICGLAEAHEGEAKYADACTRAEDRCEQATDACDSCEGG